MTLHERKLLAALVVAWEYETLVEVTLTRLADLTGEDKRSRARILVHAAIAKAHRARLMGRLTAFGNVVFPVPPVNPIELESLTTGLQAMVRRTAYAARRYSEIATLGRQANDPAAAWVCELNRAESEDTSASLTKTLKRVHDESTPTQKASEG